jgi:hypothetical protein
MSDGDNRPDHPVANVLHAGQQNVTNLNSLIELMRGTELSMIGRSDLLGIKTNTMFRRFSNRLFVEQLTATNRQISAEGTTQLKDDLMTIIMNKLQTSDESDEKLDIDKSFTGILDLKITSAYMNSFIVASGPPFTMDPTVVEPFCWSESPIRHLPHFGHPDKWNFNLESIVWVWN